MRALRGRAGRGAHAGPAAAPPPPLLPSAHSRPLHPWPRLYCAWCHSNGPIACASHGSRPACHPPPPAPQVRVGPRGAAPHAQQDHLHAAGEQPPPAAPQGGAPARSRSVWGWGRASAAGAAAPGAPWAALPSWPLRRGTPACRSHPCAALAPAGAAVQRAGAAGRRGAPPPHLLGAGPREPGGRTCTAAQPPLAPKQAPQGSPWEAGGGVPSQLTIQPVEEGHSRPWQGAACSRGPFCSQRGAHRRTRPA